MVTRYCRSCEAKTECREKLHDTVCNVCDSTHVFKYSLVREHDNSTHYSNLVKWVEWDRETGRAAKIQSNPAVELSCVFGPYSILGHTSYEWLTTEIVEIVEKTDSELKFKTKNSTYTLYNHDEL
jgi:hypothetical protein